MDTKDTFITRNEVKARVGLEAKRPLPDLVIHRLSGCK